MAVRINDYTKGRKKWKTVVIFETPPRDAHPRQSKEGREVAKFVGLGDAHNFALNLAAARRSREWAMIVIR